jgi:zinc transport system permease protein
VACGIIGTFVVVKQMASVSGGLSHAAFGGVGLGYLLGVDPMVGATGFTLCCGFGIGLAYRRIRHGLDTLIVMTWSIGMALGMLFVALSPGYAPDLMSYLFGSILFVSRNHVLLVAGLDVVIVLTVAALFKEFQALSFDEEFTEVTGVPVGAVLYVLLALIALTVVNLIRVVGVILVIALLTFPAVIARAWCDALPRMMVLATLIGAACTTAGLFLSYWLTVPTGPVIILLAVAIYIASSALRLVWAPKS